MREIIVILFKAIFTNNSVMPMWAFCGSYFLFKDIFADTYILVGLMILAYYLDHIHNKINNDIEKIKIDVKALKSTIKNN
jgi:quinol-cytochrome oxidoreductase complex cytochrome b subunit